MGKSFFIPPSSTNRKKLYIIVSQSIKNCSVYLYTHTRLEGEIIYVHIQEFIKIVNCMYIFITHCNNLHKQNILVLFGLQAKESFTEMKSINYMASFTE